MHEKVSFLQARPAPFDPDSTAPSFDAKSHEPLRRDPTPANAVRHNPSEYAASGYAAPDPTASEKSSELHADEFSDLRPDEASDVVSVDLFFERSSPTQDLIVPADREHTADLPSVTQTAEILVLPQTSDLAVAEAGTGTEAGIRAGTGTGAAVTVAKEKGADEFRDAGAFNGAAPNTAELVVETDARVEKGLSKAFARKTFDPVQPSPDSIEPNRAAVDIDAHNRVTEIVSVPREPVVEKSSPRLPTLESALSTETAFSTEAAVSIEAVAAVPPPQAASPLSALRATETVELTRSLEPVEPVEPVEYGRPVLSVQQAVSTQAISSSDASHAGSSVVAASAVQVQVAEFTSAELASPQPASFTPVTPFTPLTPSVADAATKGTLGDTRLPSGELLASSNSTVDNNLATGSASSPSETALEPVGVAGTTAAKETAGIDEIAAASIRATQKAHAEEERAVKKAASPPAIDVARETAAAKPAVIMTRGATVKEPLAQNTLAATPAAKAETSSVTPASGIELAAAPRVLRGRYVLERKIGAGGTSIVYRARDVRREISGGTSDCVALKMQREESRDKPQSLARLKREFRHAQELSHPNIVRVFDLDCEAGNWFITMELLEGRTLATALRQGADRPSPLDGYAVLQGCAAALDYAHGRGIVHCDLKPANIFITQENEIRVLDFGSACAYRQRFEGAKPRSATVIYASPQVLRGEATEPRDDVFSFACLAYEVLTGQHPFDRQSSLQAAEAGTQLQRRSPLSVSQWRALRAALSWEREARPATATQLFKALRPRALASHVPPQIARALPKRPAMLAALAVMVALSIWAVARLPSPSTEQAAPKTDAAQPGSTTDIRAAANTLDEKTPNGKASNEPAPSKTTPSKSAPNETTPNETAPNETAPNETMPSESAPGEKTPGTKAPAATTSRTSPSAASQPGPVAALSHPSPSSALQLEPAAAAPPAVVNAAAPATAPSAGTAQGSASSTRPRPSARQQIGFAQASLTVSQHAHAAVLQLVRENGSKGRVRIYWQTADGSAKAGTDYEGVSHGTAEFADHESRRVLYISLPGHIRPGQRRFFVELKGAKGTAQITGITRVPITIADY